VCLKHSTYWILACLATKHMLKKFIPALCKTCLISELKPESANPVHATANGTSSVLIYYLSLILILRFVLIKFWQVIKCQFLN
jgi:predicted neutral ceramidase superfamily lipid hydrolase